MPRALPSRPFAIVCVVGPLLCVLFAVAVAVTDDPAIRVQVTSLTLLAFGAVAAVAAYRRMRVTRIPRRRRAWFCVTLGLCIVVFANVLLVVLDAAQLTASFATLVDALLMLALLVCIVGLSLFPPMPRRGTDLARLIMDGLVVGGSVLFLADVMLFPTLLAGHDQTLLGQVQVLALPVLDLVIASLATLLIARSGSTSRTPLMLLGVAFLFYAISDLAYAVNVSLGATAIGSWWDLGWLVGYLLVTLAALHPNAGKQPEAGSLEASSLRSSIVFFTIFLIATASSMIVSTRGPLDLTAQIVWGVLILTVVARQIVLVIDNEQLRRSLEVRVLERTKELRKITNQNQLLLSSVADGIYGVDTEGRITMVNRATVKLLGRSEAELRGANAHDLFHAPRSDGTPFPYDGCYIAEATTSGLTASGEDDVYLRGDGRTMVVEATASPLRGEEGISGAVVVFRDVSQRREMDRMKQEFISVVSHELRTPLTSIRGALGLLAGGAFGELPSSAAKMIDIATSGSVRLGRLVNDILEIERLDTGMLPLAIRTHDAATACHEAIVATAGMAQAADVALALGAVDGRVRADKDRLVQVLINLVGNAVRFSDPGDSVLVAATPSDGRVEFAVSDTGRGIPEDKLESIFGRFSQVDSSDTREKGGTGLGLAICRGLIERMDGRIWVESTLGQGSTFRFELPAEDQEDETEEPQPPAAQVATGVGAV